MKKCVVLAVLTALSLIGSASTSDAGPIKRFLDNRRARVQKADRGPVVSAHPFTALRTLASGGGCVNGQCPVK